MRISDWSSDVCSSDLLPTATSRATRPAPPTADEPPHERRVDPGRRLVPYHGGNGRIARAPPARARPAVVASMEHGMISLVLVTHGRLAVEFVQALEHVVGPQQNVAALCIGPEDDMEQRRQDIIGR